MAHSCHTRGCPCCTNSWITTPACERSSRPHHTRPVAPKASQIASRQRGAATLARPALQTAAAMRNATHTGVCAFKRRYQEPRGWRPHCKLSTIRALRRAIWTPPAKHELKRCDPLSPARRDMPTEENSTAVSKSCQSCCPVANRVPLAQCEDRSRLPAAFRDASVGWMLSIGAEGAPMYKSWCTQQFAQHHR